MPTSLLASYENLAYTHTAAGAALLQRLASLCPEHLKKSREENSVLLASEHRDQIRFGIGWHVGLEEKARLLGRPANRGSSAEEIAFEMLRGVFNLCHGQRAVPLDVKRNVGANRENSGDRRRGKSQPLG